MAFGHPLGPGHELLARAAASAPPDGTQSRTTLTAGLAGHRGGGGHPSRDIRPMMAAPISRKVTV
jgi:hypothetical protein